MEIADKEENMDKISTPPPALPGFNLLDWRNSTVEMPVKRLRTHRRRKYLGSFKLEKIGKKIGEDSDRKRQNQFGSNSRSVKRKVMADSRSYRKSFTPPKISVVICLPCRKKVDPVPEGGSHGLSSTRKRKKCMAFESESDSYPHNAKRCNKLHNILLPKGRTDSVSDLNMELSEEDSDVGGKESCLRIKNGVGSNGCTKCMLGGELLYCVGKGCQRSYHLSCLDPPLVNAPPGVWHCIWCVEEKIKSDVYSVSEGVESVWDVREVASDHEGKEKHVAYLVKYKGLAPVHNRWIPEKELLLDAPDSIAKFKRRNQTNRWKKEWCIPQRLLQKRWLSFSKRDTDDPCGDLYCHYDWLVKWTGLGYDNATWELENAPFLRSPEAVQLKSDYENRHAQAERKDDEKCHDKEGKSNVCTLYAYQSRKANFSRLSELSSGDPSGAYNHYLTYVTELHEHWYKGQNAIIVDDQVDQDRILKVILFILSVQHIVRRPILIISSVTAHSIWETEFLHVAPSVNLIVYKGSEDVRKSIRSLEFFNEGGKIMFQVLLTSSRIVAEDLEFLKSIVWRTIIIDECQKSSISRYFKQFKMLEAEMKLLISSQVKDNSTYYINMLSLLSSRDDEQKSGDNEKHYSTDIARLKEMLAPYTVYECKSDSFQYEEYWVPVQLSNVQLEQYCALLLSNQGLLYKNDSVVDALREIINSIRKCCDHPYLLDKSLQKKVREGLPIEEYLDADIRVSGKLLTLEKLLREMKSRDLRALIIFQSIGCSKWDSLGDILEDFVCQRFGKDCYVRLDGSIRTYRRSKKLAALSEFNSKDSEKFVFLIENRACLPSIKLSSVDSVILFTSDLYPQNDLKALHRITINSQFEKLKVFRLYSCYTVEERALAHSKSGESIERNVDYINRNSCYSLLNWGLARLFSKVDDFHQCRILASGSKIYSEWSFLDDVLRELSDQLPCSGNNEPSLYAFISKAKQDVGAYVRDIPLMGEKEIKESEPMDHLLWKTLVDGRHRFPRWHFLSESSSRIRREVNYVDYVLNKSEVENNVIGKKTRNVASNNGDSVHRNPRLKYKRNLVAAKENKVTANKRLKSLLVIDSPTTYPAVDGIKGAAKVNTEKQKSLKSNRSLMKLKIKELCDALKLPVNVKTTCLKFFKHIKKDYNFSWKTDATSQAFQLSLCWTAAALLKYEIDCKESLALAKLHLNFKCEEAEAKYISSKLEYIKEEFGNMKMVKESNKSKNSKASACNWHGTEVEKSTTGFKCENLSCQPELEWGEEIQTSSTAVKDSNSTEFKQQDKRDGQIHGESQRLSDLDKLVDLKERYIPSCSNLTCITKSTNCNEQDLEEGEIPPSPNGGFSDGLMDLEEGEIHVSPQNDGSQNNISGVIPSSPHLCKTLVMVSSQAADFSPIENQINKIGGRITEEQSKADEIVKVKKAIDGPVAVLGRPCLSDSESELENTQPTSMAVMSDVSGIEISKDVPSSPIHYKKLRMASSDYSPKGNDFCKTTATIVEEEHKYEEIIKLKKSAEELHTSLGCHSLPDSEFEVDNMEHADIAARHVSSQEGFSENLSYSPHHSKTDKISEELSDFSPDEKRLSGSPIGEVLATMKSNEESDKVEAIASNCLPSNEVDSSTDGTKDGPLEQQSPNRIVQIIELVERPNSPQSKLPEVVGSDDPMDHSTTDAFSIGKQSGVMERVNASKAREESRVITIESDEENDEVEVVVLKSSAFTCHTQNNERTGSNHGLKDGNTILNSVRNQSPDSNVRIIESAVRPSNDPEKTFCGSSMVDVPMDHSSCAQSQGTGRANASEAGQDSGAVAPEHPSLKGTSSLVTLPDISNGCRNSYPLNQPATHAVSSSSSPMSIGIQRHQSNRSHPSDGVEVSVELHNARIEDSRLLSPSRNLQESGSETQFNEIEGLGSMLMNDPQTSQDPFCNTLQKELVGIEEAAQKEQKMHEEMELHIQYEWKKEIEEINKKYKTLLQDANRTFQQRKNDYITKFQTVFQNKCLAEALILMEMIEDEDHRQPDARPGNALVPMNWSIPLSTQHPARTPAHSRSVPPHGIPSQVASSSVPLINHQMVHPNIGVLYQNANVRAPAPRLYASQGLVSTMHLNNGLQNQNFMSMSDINARMQTQPALMQLRGSYDAHLPHSGGGSLQRRWP